MQRSIDVGDSPVWTGTTSNEQQPKFPWRVAIRLAMGAFCWIVAYLGAVGVMLPARIAEIDNENKAAIVALNSTISMVVASSPTSSSAPPPISLAPASGVAHPGSGWAPSAR